MSTAPTTQHFVAATAVSRLIDLWFWYFRFDLGPQGYVLGFNYSGSLIVLCHFVNLGLIADFMYSLDDRKCLVVVPRVRGRQHSLPIDSKGLSVWDVPI